PSVDDEETLGTIVLAAEACRDAALAYGTPFISGKDSLHNQTKTGPTKTGPMKTAAAQPSATAGVIRIPPTLLISALTLVSDVTRAVTMAAKAGGREPGSGSRLILVGETRDELRGSRLERLLGAAGSAGTAAASGRARAVPRVDLPSARRVHESVAATIAT